MSCGGTGTAGAAPAPTGEDAGRWVDHWAFKVLVWAIPIIFGCGIAFASLNVLAADVERIEKVEADKRLTVIEERVKQLEELQHLVSLTNDNVIRLCQAQGVACK